MHMLLLRFFAFKDEHLNISIR